jgi:hypothetical protein
MTPSKVLQHLIKKYAEEAPQPTVLFEDSEARFKHQRQRMAEFAHQFKTKLRVLIAEMESDIGMLRANSFDKAMQKIFIQVWNHLVGIYRSFHEDRSYEAASKLVDYVKSRNTRAVIENLDFLAQHHLQNPDEHGPKTSIKSLKLLLNFADYLEKYMKENKVLDKPKTIITPMLPPEQNLTPTWRPPAPQTPTPMILMPPEDVKKEIA